MILYSKLTRLENRKIKLTFLIKNNNPTNIEIQWLDTSFNNETFSLTKTGTEDPFIYTVEFYSHSDKILATVKNEPGKIFETNDNEFISNDLQLEISGDDIYLPFCKAEEIKISIINETGQELEAVDSYGHPLLYRSYEYNPSEETSLVYPDISLFSIIELEYIKVKINDQWEDLGDIGRYYIRVSNVLEPEGLTPILYQLGYINKKYYNKTYGAWIEE